MNTSFESLKAYIANNKPQLRTVGIAVLITTLIGLAIGLFAYNNQPAKAPDIVYQPVGACDLLTAPIAKEFLGNQVIPREGDQVIDDDGTATSKCSYTDKNTDATAMRVIAVAVRSGIDDVGVAKNNADFAANQTANGAETVTGVGDAAYFIAANSQLHVKSGKMWLIISYVVGQAAPQDARSTEVDVARKLLSNR